MAALERRPHVVILGAEWRTRALLRAQLIEEGFDVVATNTWQTMRRHLLTSEAPRLAIVDLQNLPRPKEVLRELGVLMKPARVLVLRAAGTVTQKELERLGFHVANRPITIADVVVAARILYASEPEAPERDPQR